MFLSLFATFHKRAIVNFETFHGKTLTLTSFEQIYTSLEYIQTTIVHERFQT